MPSEETLPDPEQLAEAGAARAAELRDGATAEPELPFIRFELGGERYAVPLSAVTKIERVPALVPVPRTPVFVRGIASLRGEFVTVIDLAAILGAPAGSATPHGLLVLSDGARRVGVLSDVLPDYLRARASLIGPAPTGRGGDAILAQAIEHKDGVLGVLDPKKLMDILERRIDG